MFLCEKEHRHTRNGFRSSIEFCDSFGDSEPYDNSWKETKYLTVGCVTGSPNDSIDSNDTWEVAKWPT